MEIKQSVNLYNFDASGGDSKLLRARGFFALNIFLIIILALFYAGQYGYSAYISSTSFSLSNQESQLLQEVARRKKAVESLKSNKTHRNTLRRLNATLEEKGKLLDFLKTQKEPKRFSYYLVDLSEKSHPQMQIDEVTFDNYGQSIDFKGQSRSSKVVAEWISSLEQTQAYDGVNFASLSIESDEDEPFLTFEVKNSYD